MPEVISVALLNFLRLSIEVTILYLLYLLIRFTLSRLTGGTAKNEDNETWEGIRLLYSVPGSIFGFLILDYLVICLGSTIGSGGLGGIFRSGAWTVAGTFARGMESFLGILGCTGIFAATVFGIYQDHPHTRFRTLGVIAVFSALIGIGSGMH